MIANQPIVIDNVCHILVNDIVLGKTDNFLKACIEFCIEIRCS